MGLKYLLPALAVAGRVAAQCGSTTTTLSSQADASGLASGDCVSAYTYSGSVAIATDAPDLRIDSIRRITGSLIGRDNDVMSSLEADSLQQIDDTFGLDGFTVLTSLNMPALTSADTVEWLGLPNLQQLSLTAGLTQASTLSIQNTGLYTLNGINLEAVENVNIANNNDLTKIGMQVDHINGQLILQANGRDLSVEFPNLQYVYNATFRNCSDISLDSLSAVNGSLGFISNFMEDISAPNLTKVGGTLGFISNAQLSNVSMPELKMLTGGLLIANNSNLADINGFPSLTTVMGNIDCSGNIESLELPDLNLVRGAFSLQSTEDVTDSCNHFDSIQGPNEDIRGKYRCKGNIDRPSTLNGGSTTDSGSGSSTSSGAAVPLLIPGATGVLGVVAAIFGML